MTDTPPLQQSPATPLPPRSSNHGVLIALIVLAFIAAGAIAAFFYGARIISRSVSVREEHSAAGNKQVTIRTPVGNLEVNQGAQVDPALIGLPVYPGARRVVGKNSTRMNMDLPGQQEVGLVTAQFETPDSIERVASYYREQLKGEISKTTAGDFGQKIIFEVKRDRMERVVSLKASGSGTAITLVRIRHGAAEAN